MKHERQCMSLLFSSPSLHLFSIQVCQSENDTLKQLVIRDGHEEAPIPRISHRFIPITESSGRDRIRSEDEIIARRMTVSGFKSQMHSFFFNLFDIVSTCFCFVCELIKN